MLSLVPSAMASRSEKAMAQTSTLRVVRSITLVAAIACAAPLGTAASDLNLTSPQEPPQDRPLRIDLPNCSRWTDECVTCMRETKDGAPACANIGIACQPKAVRCLDEENPRAGK